MPTILVEFVSTSRRDRRRDHEEKRGEYLALGIAEYWVINRFRRTMTVHQSPPAGPSEQVIQESETYRMQRLPGFELPLGRILALANQWGTKD
jgi:Uma2 family endonuclease